MPHFPSLLDASRPRNFTRSIPNCACPSQEFGIPFETPGSDRSATSLGERPPVRIRGPAQYVQIYIHMFVNSNMRFHHTLDDLLGNPLRLRVLRLLARSPSQGFTGRELARLCGASPSQTILALQSLEESGIVGREVAGPAHVWRISRHHILSGHLIRLFEEEERSLERLKSELQRAMARLPVKRSLIFGSVARREERPASDIDLFVEVRSLPDKDRVEVALTAATVTTSIRFGNPLSALVLTNDQVRRNSNPSLIQNILREGDPVTP